MPGARLIAELLLTRGRTHRYGTHPSQRADLHLPAGDGPHPVMVLIHGGSWRKRHGSLVMRALARDLVRRGRAAWNSECRRLGEGGGSPEELPERFALGDPLALVPLGAPALLVHGRLDETVSVKLSRSYARAARAAGGVVELVEIDGPAGRHRAHIDPRGAAWAAVTDWLARRA